MPCRGSFSRRTWLWAVLSVLALAARPAALLAQSDLGTGVKSAELSPAAEQSIDKALSYLAKSQKADGSWAGQYPVASTSASLMAFMLKGYFPEKGQYSDNLRKAVDYLLKSSKDGAGYMGTSMYEHGLATLALSEVWGMSTRKEIRETLKKAVDIILRAQNPAGGWRYRPQPEDADISVTVMQIVALSSAKEAGIYVPDKTIEKATAYVKRLQTPEGGFGYSGPQAPGFARSAAGTMSLLMLGELKAKETQKALAYMTKLPKSIFQSEQFFYYGHYYAVQAMYQAGESYYQKWYPSIRDALLKAQASNGAWSGEGGVEFSTAVGVLIMGVPYRYLPIYQR